MNKLSTNGLAARSAHLPRSSRFEPYLLSAMLGALALFCVAKPVSADDALPEFDCVIEPSAIVDIGSATAGVLEIVTLDRGDVVNKNQVVARLESGTEKAAAELARVRSTFNTGIELRRTSAEFFNRNQERSRSLTTQNAISKQQLDQLDTETIVAELQVRQEQDNKQLAKLEYRRAQQALGRRSIKSPIDGVVMERFRSVGEYVEDTAILRVAQLDPLHVETIVPVSYMGRIKSGMQAVIRPVVPGEKPEYAVVTRIDRVADAASGTFGVRLEMANPDGNIVTGVRCAMEFNGKTSGVAKRQEPPVKPVAARETSGTQAKSTLTNSKTASGELPQCFEAGPFNQRSIASDVLEQLAQTGNQARLREVEGSHPGQFFVLTEKTTNKAEAQQLLADLAQKGITDTHLLLRGVHTGSISLGLFKNRETAMNRADEFGRLGLDIHVSPRSPTTLWLEISSSVAMDNNALRRLLSPHAPAQISDVSCGTLQTYVN